MGEAIRMNELPVRHGLRGLLFAVGVAALLGGGGVARGQQRPNAELATQADAVLRKYCFECHGKNPKKPKGDLNLFDRAHLLDKERGLLVGGKPDESELLKKVVEGEMPPGKRPKPTDTERKLLHDWVAAGAPAVPEHQPADAGRSPLAGRVKELFRARCFECHGGSKTNAGVKILDHELLIAKKKIIPGKPDESLLFQLLTARDESVMPP
jgi:mono/diheme cytochrome c family protein